MPDTRDRQFLKKLLETFRVEAKEHIDAVATRLTELERAPAEAHGPIVEVAFREAHSLKAAARAVNRNEIERICQSMESLFALMKRGERRADAPLLAALHAANDRLADLLALNGEADSGAERSRTNAVLDALAAARESGAPPSTAAEGAAADPASQPAPAAAVATASDSIRIPAKRMDALLRQAEDLLTVKLGAQQQAAAAAALKAMLEQLNRDSAARPGQGEGSALLLAERLRDFAQAAAAQARAAGARVDRVQESLKHILMLDARSLLDSLPKAVRDLAREQDKDIDFVVEGADFDIDRRILDALRDPLLHLVRNAVDHGIETREQRRRSGKPARASLRLALARSNGDKVEITLADDGAGVALKRVAAAAVKAGLLPAEHAARAGTAELLPLIFHTGLSTSPMITELSGRGLGLAIVRERIERLGGSIAVESREGAGATFRLRVPLTLAAFRGIPVRAAAQTFVMPTLGVERVLRTRRDALQTIENRPALPVNGSLVPLVPLSVLLELPAAAPAPDENVYALVLGAAAGRVAVEVDEIHGDQEVLVKPLGKCLERVRNVAGATVLGDGHIAPILNVHDLLKSAVLATSASASTSASEPAPAPAATERQLRVLVVEDSITARSLIRHTLEAAGYRVAVAADGVEAWGALRLEPFDIVVSDVEMPRMNGFDLTARIRADPRLADLPVVLLTALASREDRERGVEVGANAYLLKGEFDQDKLLEALRRLA